MEFDERRERTLYIKDLDEDVTEDLLYELFLQAGPLASVTLKKAPAENRMGKPSAFVEYKQEESVPYAIALFKGIQLFDKELTILPRDKTEMANKLKHAANEARSLRLNEQAPCLEELQRQIRWPEPQPNEPFRYAQHYTRLAVAGMFHPNAAPRFQAVPRIPPQFYTSMHFQQLYQQQQMLMPQMLTPPNSAAMMNNSAGGDYFSNQQHPHEQQQQHYQQQERYQQNDRSYDRGRYNQRGREGDDRRHRDSPYERNSGRNFRDRDQESSGERGDDRPRVHRSNSERNFSNERSDYGNRRRDDRNGHR